MPNKQMKSGMKYQLYSSLLSSGKNTVTNSAYLCIDFFLSKLQYFLKIELRCCFRRRYILYVVIFINYC